MTEMAAGRSPRISGPGQVQARYVKCFEPLLLHLPGTTRAEKLAHYFGISNPSVEDSDSRFPMEMYVENGCCKKRRIRNADPEEVPSSHHWVVQSWSGDVDFTTPGTYDLTVVMVENAAYHTHNGAVCNSNFYEGVLSKTWKIRIIDDCRCPSTPVTSTISAERYDQTGTSGSLKWRTVETVTTGRYQPYQPPVGTSEWANHEDCLEKQATISDHQFTHGPTVSVPQVFAISLQITDQFASTSTPIKPPDEIKELVRFKAKLFRFWGHSTTTVTITDLQNNPVSTNTVQSAAHWHYSAHQILTCFYGKVLSCQTPW